MAEPESTRPAARRPMPTIRSSDDWDDTAQWRQAGEDLAVASLAALPAPRSPGSVSASTASPTSPPTGLSALVPAVALPPPIVSHTPPPPTANVTTDRHTAPAPPPTERLQSWGSTCSSILPYRPVKVCVTASAAPGSGRVDGESCARLEEGRPTPTARDGAREEEARVLSDKSYDLVIAAGSLMGGFTIKEVLAPPDLHGFSHEAAYCAPPPAFLPPVCPPPAECRDARPCNRRVSTAEAQGPDARSVPAPSADAYRVLLPLAATLDLYAVVTLVLNRYLAARAFKDGDWAAHAKFVASSAPHRRHAVWAFVSALPVFVVAAAAKQLHGLSGLLAAGPVLVLAAGCVVMFYSVLLQTRQLQRVIDRMGPAAAPGGGGGRAAPGAAGPTREPSAGASPPPARPRLAHGRPTAAAAGTARTAGPTLL